MKLLPLPLSAAAAVCRVWLWSIATTVIGLKQCTNKHDAANIKHTQKWCDIVIFLLKVVSTLIQSNMDGKDEWCSHIVDISPARYGQIAWYKFDKLLWGVICGSTDIQIMSNVHPSFQDPARFWLERAVRCLGNREKHLF